MENKNTISKVKHIQAAALKARESLLKIEGIFIASKDEISLVDEDEFLELKLRFGKITKAFDETLEDLDIDLGRDSLIREQPQKKKGKK